MSNHVIDTRIAPVPRGLEGGGNCQKDELTPCSEPVEFDVQLARRATKYRNGDRLFLRYCRTHASRFCIKYGLCIDCGVHFSKHIKSDRCGPCSRAAAGS